MNHRFVSLASVALFALIGCGGGSPPATGEGLPGYRVEAGLYCAIVARPGLVRWDRDVVTACADAPVQRDDAPPAACSVQRIGDGGALSPLSVPNAQLALRAVGDRLVVLTTTQQLQLVQGGQTTLIAAWARSPSVSRDGQRIAYIGLAEGATAQPDGYVEEGTATRVMVVDLTQAQPSPQVVVEDPNASLAFPLPGADLEVLYVSGITGLSSFWRAKVDGLPFQVTNQGMDEVGQGFVPTPTRDLVWMPTGSVAVFSAQMTTTPEVWRVDLDSADAELLGPGEWPQLDAEGNVIARGALASDASCALSYRPEGG